MEKKRTEPEATVVSLHSARTVRISGHVVGQFVGLSAQGELLVTYPENVHGPLLARSTIPLTAADVRDYAEAAREVLITFDGEQSDRPIVVGVLQPAIRKAPAPGVDSVTLDDKTLVLEGRERIELRCGKASIVLTRDGQISLRGTYISAHSSGPYRIRGGSVEIN